MTGLSVDVSLHVDGRLAIADVSGEIDISNASRLGRQLGASRLPSSGGLVVDLSAVAYLDSAGIDELLRVAAQLARERRRLAFVIPDGSPLHRLSKVARFEEAGVICASRDDAAKLATEPAGRGAS